ncbi:MAG: MocR-like pyridoxine biosynthesis transcription factor PdxR [Paracoccaceae bacterium]
MAIPAESITLDPDGDGTLQSRIVERIAGAILQGRFRAGERMPSTRALARQLGVARITVTLAYTELVASDYLTARGRSGTFVSPSAPAPPVPAARAGASRVDWAARLGPPAPQGPRKPDDWSAFRYPFVYGQVDPHLFDASNWRLCALRALGRRDFDVLTADRQDADDPRLVEFLCRQTLPRRGIDAHPDEVLVTLGAQNALWLTATLLAREGTHVAIEDPCYPGLRDVLARTPARVTPVPVDRDGLDPAALPGGATVAFVTPSHHCPTAVTMPAARRRALLDWASANDAVVVEDDYETEMSFLAPPAPALKSLDREGRVIYAGSFSKSIFPGLRLGYLVGPPAFVAAARALRARVLRHPSGLLMRTTAYFLSLGHYDALIRRTQAAFHDRRRILDRAVADAGLTVAGRAAMGGSSLWMRAAGTDTAALARALHPAGVLIEPGAHFFADPAAHADTYRLAYSSIRGVRIPDGVKLIGQALDA